MGRQGLGATRRPFGDGLCRPIHRPTPEYHFHGVLAFDELTAEARSIGAPTVSFLLDESRGMTTPWTRRTTA